MDLVNRKSALWQYLPSEIKGLIEDGEKILAHAHEHQENLSDFSYLVFPFSKAYEGFLKRLFLDLDLIREDEYYGDEIRIGRILNPHFMKEKGNVFNKLCSKTGNGNDIVQQLWETWREGRNEVFHYFPHNFRRLSYKEASKIIQDILRAMESAVGSCYL